MQGAGRQKTEAQEAEGCSSRIGQSHKVRSPPRCHLIGVGAHGDGVRDGRVEVRIDDIALIPALEQIPGLVGTDPVGRQPVKDDVEAKAQAPPFTQDGNLVDRIFDRTANPEAGVRLGKIADQQRIVASGQEGIETDVVEAQIGGPGQPQLPIAGALKVIKTANGRRLQLQAPTRLPHPGRSDRGLQAPAHTLETAKAASGCEEMIAIRELVRLFDQLAGRSPLWLAMCRYLRTVRSMAAASGFPLLGFLSPFGSRAFSCVSAFHAAASVQYVTCRQRLAYVKIHRSEEGNARLAP
ncbi:MAG: hypothetical protein GEV13_23645 [Rhodospirillales bacterium]|nr:hypothetical protein [Rhodospirillales bacterium]